jgi:hypothetical protein
MDADDMGRAHRPGTRMMPIALIEKRGTDMQV